MLFRPTSRPFVACLALTLLGVSWTAQAERYFTWVDENGVLHHSVIQEPANPLLERAEAMDRTRAAESALDPAKPDQVQAEPEPLHSGPTQDAAPSAQVPRSSDALAAGLDSTIDGSTSDLSTTDYSTTDYVDAGELERNGYVREGEGGRFYVWTDINGVVHSSPYPTDQEAKANSPLDDPKYSPFQLVERLGTVPLPQDRPVDDFARQLFKLDEPSRGMLAQLAEDCCEWLDPETAKELEGEDGVLVEFVSGQGLHPFLTGRSAFELMRLPEATLDYRLRVRAFANPSVLYPSFVLLDDKLRPVRMIRHALFEFEPENWFRYGYLEGWINVEPQQGETYLLVLTVAEDMKATTRVEHKHKTLEIQHRQTGLLQVALP